MASDGTIDLTIQNPSVFYLEYDKGLWSDAKTIYDPCPVGWKVPYKNFWTKAGIIENLSSNKYWDATNKGMNIPASISGVDTWYPATGYRSNSTGLIGNAGINGAFWSSAYYSSNSAHYMRFFNNTITTSKCAYVSTGHSVRAVRE